MTNKVLSKTVNKGVWFSVVVGVVLVLSIVFSVIFGVNYAANVGDNKTLTVQMNKYFYDTDLDELEDACTDVFKTQGLKVNYTYYGDMSGDTCEIVYVFENAESDKLQAAKTAIATIVDTNTQTGGVWHGSSMRVTTGNEKVEASIPTSYTVKATIVAVVLSLVVGIYTAIRYGVWKGVVACVAPLMAMTFSASAIVLTRIPVTTSVFYAVAVSGLLAAVFTVLTLSKLRGADENEKGEQLIVNNVACKEMLVIGITLGVAILLVGIIATWPVRWFALCALIGLDTALYTNLFVVPYGLLLVQKCAERKAAETTASGYVGAKKSEDKDEE